MNRLNIRFASAEHRDFFLRMMSEARKNDCYHQSFFYVMGIAPETCFLAYRLKERIRPETSMVLAPGSL